MKTYSQASLGNPRGFFLIFCSLFLAGDIISVTWWWELSMFCLVLLLLVALSSLWRRMIVYGIFGFLLGSTLGYFAHIEKQEEYRALERITSHFTLKWYTTGTLEKRVYKKERSDVYRLKIDIFDTRSTSIFVEVPSNLHIELGDILAFTGSIRKNIEFPLVGYDRFSYFQGGYGQIFLASFERKVSEKKDYIVPVRKYWESVFQSYFPRDVWGTLLGMTIGSIELLSRDMKNAFIQSGVSHILVVSGSNIAFLIILLSFFLKYIHLRKVGRIIIISAVVGFYGFLVWWDVSVIRATLMGVLSYMITEYGSKSSSKALLWLALLILTIMSPLSPIYDPGFWLSFSATLGILLFHKKIAALCQRLSLPKVITSILSVTFWATLGSLPVMIFHFGTVALASLIANIMIAGLLGWILFSSVAFVVIEFFSSTLWYLFWFLVYIPTQMIIEIASFFRSGTIVEIPEMFRTPIMLFIFWAYLFFFLEEDVFSPEKNNTH